MFIKELFRKMQAGKPIYRISGDVSKSLFFYNDPDFNHFYNSFANIHAASSIDYLLKTSYELYEYYSRFLFHMLDKRPPGTRLVTYQAPGKQIPASYRLADNSYRGELKMWIKG